MFCVWFDLIAIFENFYNAKQPAHIAPNRLDKRKGVRLFGSLGTQTAPNRLQR